MKGHFRTPSDTGPSPGLTPHVWSLPVRRGVCPTSPVTSVVGDDEVVEADLGRQGRESPR